MRTCFCLSGFPINFGSLAPIPRELCATLGIVKSVKSNGPFDLLPQALAPPLEFSAACQIEQWLESYESSKSGGARFLKGDYMSTRISSFLGLALTCALAGSVIAGCGNKNSAVTPPTVEETKSIVEEGFIYGLPVMMNYAVMNEYAVDRNSGQFKAPFTQIKNEHRVFTYQDTAIITPNSDTPYSILWMDLRRSRWLCFAKILRTENSAIPCHDRCPV
jgi:hypothetical protein